MRRIVLIFCIVMITKIPVLATLTAPYFGLSVNLQGADYFHLYGEKSMKKPTQLIVNTMSDLKLGKEIFYFGQLGSSIVLTDGAYDNFGGFTFGLGLGYYIFDKRENGRGDSLTISLSYIFRTLFGAREDFTLSKGYSFENGGQAMLSYYHNFYKYLALKVAFSLDISAVSLTYYDYYGGQGIGLNYALHLGIAF